MTLLFCLCLCIYFLLKKKKDKYSHNNKSIQTSYLCFLCLFINITHCLLGLWVSLNDWFCEKIMCSVLKQLCVLYWNKVNMDVCLFIILIINYFLCIVTDIYDWSSCRPDASLSRISKVPWTFGLHGSSTCQKGFSSRTSMFNNHVFILTVNCYQTAFCNFGVFFFIANNKFS